MRIKKQLIFKIVVNFKFKLLKNNFEIMCLTYMYQVLIKNIHKIFNLIIKLNNYRFECNGYF